jgi:hypothetical protein
MNLINDPWTQKASKNWNFSNKAETLDDNFCYIFQVPIIQNSLAGYFAQDSQVKINYELWLASHAKNT